MACETEFGLAPEEEEAVNSASPASPTDEDDPLDGPVPPTEDDEPLDGPSTTPPPAPALAASSVPAEVMARVERCAVIAISSRGVAAAGCPGVGVVVYRLPPHAPRMRGMVIVNPSAPLASGTAGSPEASSVDVPQLAAPRKNDGRRESDEELEQPASEKPPREGSPRHGKKNWRDRQAGRAGQ